jgi:hypothetical protein
MQDDIYLYIWKTIINKNVKNNIKNTLFDYNFIRSQIMKIQNELFVELIVNYI